MKIKVWDKKEEKVLYLRVVEDNFGVSLIAVDAEGKERVKGTILQISPDGKMFLFGGLSKEIGRASCRERG